MYNHYIPQSDGSFRRSAVPEPSRKPQRSSGAPSAPPSPPDSIPEPEISPPCPSPEPEHRKEPCPPVQENPLSFLRKLLPKNLDISDLIIIGLLLLLASDDCEDDLSPILTIALYFLL